MSVGDHSIYIRFLRYPVVPPLVAGWSVHGGSIYWSKAMFILSTKVVTIHDALEALWGTSHCPARVGTLKGVEREVHGSSFKSVLVVTVEDQAYSTLT